MFSNLKDVYKKAVCFKKVSCQLKETVFRGSGGGEGTGRQGIST